MLVWCLFFAFAVARVSAGNIPSFISPCSASDPNLNDCLQKVIQEITPKFAEGLPELGIAPLDPVQLGKVVVNNPALKIIFTDTVVSGLSGSKINSFKMNLEKGKATIDFTANVTLKAHYDMDGQVLILPIKGTGPAKIRITNLRIVVKYDFETVNGHWIVTGYKDHYKMDRAQFKFENLFGGNKQLADTTEKFTNQNWELIMQEIAPPAINQIINSCVDKVKQLYQQVPANELLRP